MRLLSESATGMTEDLVLIADVLFQSGKDAADWTYKGIYETQIRLADGEAHPLLPPETDLEIPLNGAIRQSL